MILSGMRDALRRFGFDPSDPLTVWLNAAMHEFVDAAPWPFLEQVQTITAPTSGTEVSAISDGVERINSVYLADPMSNDHKLSFWRWHKFLREISNPDSTGKPEIWSVWGSRELHVYPVANGAYDLKVYYIGNVSDMSADDDEPGGGLIPERWHYTIVQGAAAIALQAENEEERSATARALFESGISRGVAHYGLRHGDEFEQVQDVMGYGST